MGGVSRSCIRGAKFETIRGIAVKDHLGRNFERAPSKIESIPTRREVGRESLMMPSRLRQRIPGNALLRAANLTMSAGVAVLNAGTRLQLRTRSEWLGRTSGRLSMEATNVLFRTSTAIRVRGNSLYLQVSQLNVKDNTLTVR